MVVQPSPPSLRFPKGHRGSDRRSDQSSRRARHSYPFNPRQHGFVEKDGGLPPDSVVQTVDEILKDSVELVEKYHDRSFQAMHRLALAPCSPFSVSDTLLRESAKLARELDVRLHTHLAETKDEEDYTLEHFNMRPLEYMQSLGWVGEDVWYAHGIHFNTEELQVLADTGTGVCHCPTSNLSLSSGVACIPR